ncbi:MAG: DUF2283 domain-containing protein [Stellaceae bacterium]
MIRTNYDPEADVLHVAFGQPGVRSDTSEEVAPGVFVEFDLNGNPIGIEVISVRRRSGGIASLQAAAR